MTFVVPHWSATRFMTWDICPGEFKARYVDGQPVELTEAMAFGQAVHIGLEAHYRGEDAIRAFRASWKQYALELAETGPVDGSLTAAGLDLIDQVVDMGLSGTPERGFSIDTNDALGAPIVGAIDLWGDDHVIYDFKTTRGLWSQERAQKEVWQPSIYGWARWLEDPEYSGDFEYIVMNRITRRVQRFRREWEPGQATEQMNAAYDRMRCIANDFRAGRFVCHGKHGFCPECGDRWTHDHDCHPSTGRVRLGDVGA